MLGTQTHTAQGMPFFYRAQPCKLSPLPGNRHALQCAMSAARARPLRTRPPLTPQPFVERECRFHSSSATECRHISLDWMRRLVTWMTLQTVEETSCSGCAV